MCMKPIAHTALSGALTGRVLCALVCALLVAGQQPAPGQEDAYMGLICRGVEESGRLFIGQPGFGPHLVSLFVTGPNPLSATQTLPEHVAWVNDPLHSYVADGTGGMCIWAHPGPRDAAAIVDLPGLSGVEVSYAGDGLTRDGLWDQVLTACHDAQRPFIWAFADDDTHSRTSINLSWFAARVSEVNVFALKAALRHGSFYISNGPLIEDISVQGGRITVRPAEPMQVLWLASGQYLGAEPTAQMTVTTEPGESHCLRCDDAVSNSTLDTTAIGLSPEQLKFVRAVVRAEPSKVAQTQPWRIRPDGSIDNPYPDSGTWIRGQSHNHTDAPPGNTTIIHQYRLAYQQVGQVASFSTDYSYWESPHQHPVSDGTPLIAAVTPSRCPANAADELVISGANLDPAATVHIGPRTLQPTPTEAGALRVQLPADVAPGLYDVCVTNPDSLRGCLPLGLTVQAPDSANDGWQTFSAADGLEPEQLTSIACFGDEVWAGGIGGACRYKDGAWVSMRDHLPGNSAYAMVAAPGGGVWIAGSSGLSFCGADGTSVKHKVGQEEKLSRKTSSERWGRMAFDGEGTLWVANRWGAGLGVLRAGQWERLVKADGIPHDGQSAVACDSSGTAWVGFGNGLYRLVEEQWQPVALPPELADCRYTSALAITADGSCWAAVTSGSRPDLGGVVLLSDHGDHAYTTANSPLPSARIRDILVTREGDVWFASDYGLARLSADGAWRQFNSVNSGLGYDTVLAMTEDADGRIWFASARGASCYTRR